MNGSSDGVYVDEEDDDSVLVSYHGDSNLDSSKISNDKCLSLGKIK